MPIQGSQQFRNAHPSRGRRDQHLGPLRLRTDRVGAGRDGTGLVARSGRHEHRPQLRCGPLRARLVALVDHDEVGDLEQARLDRLDLVAHLGCLQDHGRVGRRRDFHLALAGPDGLDEQQVEAASIQHGRRRGRRRGESPGMTARRHRADENVGVGRVRLHPDPVAQERAAGDRARWVDGDDRHRPADLAGFGDERRDEGGLAGPGWAGDPDQMGRPGKRIEAAHRRFGDRRPVLDGGQQPGGRQAVAAEGGLDQAIGPGARRLPHPSRGGARSPAGTPRPGRSSCPARRSPRHRPP